MNHTEVIQEIAKKTGLDSSLCDKVIKAFESQSGAAMLGKLAGKDMDLNAISAKVAGKTGVSKDICDKILSALNSVTDSGLAEKLGSFLKN